MESNRTSGSGPGLEVRHLMRRLDRVGLGTIARDGGGAPYVSLAMVALDHDGSPILLLSRLADHTVNIERDPRVSLLFDGSAGTYPALTAARATLQGRAVRTENPRLRRRYLARHPDAGQYVGFRDFGFFRVQPERAHLVAGFGRIHWVDAGEVLIAQEISALAEAEADIVAHMNEDHADAVAAYAEGLGGQEGGPWRMTGLDPDGADLRCNGRAWRLAFERLVDGPEAARAELVRLVKRARVQLSSFRHVPERQ